MLKLHKADSNCRVCKHSYAHHCLYVRVEQGGMQQQFIQPLEIVPCDAYTHFVPTSTLDTTGKCGCLEWQPMDNLEYLELKAEQQKSKHEDNWD